MRAVANREVKVHSVNPCIQLCGSPNWAVAGRIGFLVHEPCLGKELWGPEQSCALHHDGTVANNLVLSGSEILGLYFDPPVGPFFCSVIAAGPSMCLEAGSLPFSFWRDVNFGRRMCFASTRARRTSNRRHIRCVVRRHEIQIILVKWLVDKILYPKWDLLLGKKMRHSPGEAAVSSQSKAEAVGSGQRSDAIQTLFDSH